MSYLQDKKIKRGKIFKIVVGLVLLFILFYFRGGILRGTSFATGEFFSPALRIGGTMDNILNNLNAYFSSKRSLSVENENLKQELLARSAQNANYDILATENEDLKAIFMRTPENRKAMLAAILSKPNKSAYDTLIIDIGSNNGVNIGDMVFAQGDIPIGQVGMVSPSTSKVVLFSNPREKIQAVLSEAQQPPADPAVFWELVGRGGGNFEMILPRDFVLNTGDAISLPGLKPYTVAIVETILSDPRDPFKKALLTSPINLQGLKFVEVELQ
ncbi:MAG: rod shape-determining protein MreC [Candidatus Paceibacterota bacterium]|jgi:cell shape-determining protein MreC